MTEKLIMTQERLIEMAVEYVHPFVGPSFESKIMTFTSWTSVMVLLGVEVASLVDLIY